MSESETRPTQRTSSRRRGRAPKTVAPYKRLRIVGIVVAAIVGLLALLIALDFAQASGRIHSGVTVSGVDLGGLTPSLAQETLRAELTRRVGRTITLVAQNQSWEVTPGVLAIGFDYPAEIRRANAVGREGTILKQLSERLRARMGGVALTAAPRPAVTMATELLDEVAGEIDDPAKNFDLKIADAQASIVEGHDGTVVNRGATLARLLSAAVSTGRRPVQVVLRVDRMKVDKEAAQDGLAVAKQMLSGRIRVTHLEKSWSFTPREFGDWISSEPTRAPNGWQLRVAFDPTLAGEAVVNRVGDALGRPARDASFKVSAGRVRIVPSQQGVGPNVVTLCADLDAVTQEPNSSRTVEMETGVLEPKVSTDDARAMGIEERIGTYTTTYPASNRPRVNNIHLLGDALNGTLVAPGAVFSFNEAAGQRTADKGYQEAFAIVNGKFVPQLGGGVCQVGTTVFNSVFVSGLPVVQRRNHSYYISHYPTGRDATVSWGSPDFKFRNDTENWVLVAVSYTSSSITVSLYGTDPGYSVSSTTSAWRDIKPYPTTKIKDPHLATGEQVVEDAGIDGRSVTVRRTVRKGGIVVRVDTFVSVYKPKPATVRVGTGPAASPDDTSTP